MKSPLLKPLKFLLKISISIFFLLILTECTTTYDMPTAKNIDINKYMGKWIEIARIETPFQKGKFDSIAEYNLNADNTVSIKNSATSANGKRTTATAVAYIPDLKDHSKLRVSFFRPFYSDYWILEVEPNYKWALVGTPDKKYLWILSRTDNLDDISLMHILTTAKMRGFDTSKLLYNINLKKNILNN